MKKNAAVQMASEIQIWPIERLIPYEKNARTHDANQVDKIASSIVEFGFTQPILVDENDGIIAGHGRLLAAKKLGLTEVPVIPLTHMSDSQRRAYILADNKLAELAGWDQGLLREEIQALDSEGFDVDLLGFSSEEIDGFLAEATADFDTEEDANSKALPRALQMAPPREYAVVMCDDLDEWERLKVALNLQPVRRGGYKAGSAFDAVGTQRVVRASELLAILERSGVGE